MKEWVDLESEGGGPGEGEAKCGEGGFKLVEGGNVKLGSEN